MEIETKRKDNRWIKGAFAILAWLFFISIIVQVFLAGIALFVDFGHWNFHQSFVHYFEFVPVVMLILAFFGGIPKNLRWHSLSLYIMIILQYVTVNLTGKIPYIGAIHPIIALLLFWRALFMVKEGNELINKNI